MNKPFKITRNDGRSNAQVIIDYVRDKEPGVIFEYDELIAALNHGANHVYSLRDLQGIVFRLYSRMLKECARTLHNVRHVGYRLAPGSQHLVLAGDRNRKASTQMEKGVLMLQHVRYDEMDANQRLAHEAQLIISGAMYQQITALERRQTAVEAAIHKILNR